MTKSLYKSKDNKVRDLLQFASNIKTITEYIVVMKISKHFNYTFQKRTKKNI